MLTRLSIPSLFMLLLILAACGKKEIETLRAENDSLRGELVSKNEMVSVMKTVKDLIDSIDVSRKVLRMDLNEGMPPDAVATRLRDINDYVKNTQDHINTIEKQLRATNKQNNGYIMMMDALKSELGIRVQEVESLQSAIEEYKKENEGLVKTVKLQQAEMTEMQTKIEAKQQELALLDAKVKNMVSEFQVSEADAYFARAKAVEEAANRTRLAPRKKKETYREALELYKKALSLGKKEAQAKITDLEKKVK